MNTLSVPNGIQLGQLNAVLRIVKVSVAHRNLGTDEQIFEFLQLNDFVKLSKLQNRVFAEPPQDKAYLFEYESTSRANQKPARLFSREEPEKWRLFETGVTEVIPVFQPSDTETTVFVIRGRHIAEWEITCKSVETKILDELKMMVRQDRVMAEKRPMPTLSARLAAGPNDAKTIMLPPSPLLPRVTPLVVSRGDEGAEICRTIDQNLTGIIKALAELERLSPGAWAKYVARQGPNRVEVDMGRVFKIVEDSGKVMGSILDAMNTEPTGK